MRFLPVANRELVVASRRPSTFRVRWISALVAIVIGAAFMILAHAGAVAVGPNLFGRLLFQALAWLCFLFVLPAGVFLTSDCLSLEKREGTLGLLFLTDLRGHDVVVGKLMASSLTLFLALLGVFPILGIPLLMGGVTGVQFGKTVVALTLALGMSLSAGLAVSSVSQHAQRSMAATVLLLGLLNGIPPAVAMALDPGPWREILMATGPWGLMLRADWGRLFWTGAAINALLVVMLLGWSCVQLPRGWQDWGEDSGEVAERRLRWRLGRRGVRQRLRERWLEPNPIRWIAGRECWPSRVLWGLVALLALYFVGALYLRRDTLWLAWGYVAGALGWLTILVAAMEAGRFFVEGRRSGCLEVVLGTAIRPRDCIQGQWRALLGRLGWPLVVLISLQAIGGGISQRRIFGTFGAALGPLTNAAAGTGGTNAIAVNVSIGPQGVAITNGVVAGPAASGLPAGGTLGPLADWIEWMPWLMAALTVVGMTSNLAAILWFGMWTGLRAKSVPMATLMTFVWVQIIPSVVLAFASLLILPLFILPAMTWQVRSAPALMIFLMPVLGMVVPMLFSVGKDVGFVVWAHHRLHREFRKHAIAIPDLAPVLPPRLPPVRRQSP